MGEMGINLPFLVLVPAIQRPFAVSLAVPNSGDVEFRPEALVFPIGPLLEGGDGHSLGDLPDADLVLDVLGAKAHAIPVEMGLGFSPDVVWNGQGGSRFPEAKVDGGRVGFGGGEIQGGGRGSKRGREETDPLRIRYFRTDPIILGC